MADVAKLGTFYVFNVCACGDRRGRCSIFIIPARPSAQIGVVEALSLRRRANFCKVRDEPSSEIVRVEALSLWRRANLLLAIWSLEP